MPKPVDSRSELAAMGKRIADTRELRGLTQRQLGDLVGMDPQNISKIETGRQATTSTAIREFCGALNVSADYLVRGIGAPPSADGKPPEPPPRARYASLATFIAETSMDEDGRRFMLAQPDPGFDPGQSVWSGIYHIYLGARAQRSRSSRPS